jgi:hypothetical protein
MLEDLDAIDWSSLTHAHGPATDVPQMLRSLLSEDADVWMQACAELHETIWYQGTVFPASATAIPFLLELLTHADLLDPGCPDPGNPSGYRVSPAGCAVSLLCCIATGVGYIGYVLRVDGEESLRRRLAKSGRSAEEALEQERDMMEAIQRGISAGLRQLLPYMGDPAPDLRASVAEALGNFPEHTSWLLPAIDAAVAAESDPHVRQVLAESKARLISVDGHG